MQTLFITATLTLIAVALALEIVNNRGDELRKWWMRSRYNLHQTRLSLAGDEPYEMWMDAKVYNETKLPSKTSTRKLDKNHYSPSIIQTDTGERCFVCGRRGIQLARHEIYQGLGKRQKCKRLGIWISVCPECHGRIHSFPAGNTARWLDMMAQRATMDFYGLTKEQFIAELGRNYLDD